MKRPSAIVLFVALFGAATIAQTRRNPPPTRDRLLGAWNLVSFTSFDANGASRPGAYDLRRIFYDAAGQMSAHLMHSSNKSENTPATDEERGAAFRRYLGYYGPFTVDEGAGTVTHHVLGSSNPSWVGSNQVRYFSLSDDGSRLTLSVKNNLRTTGTLVWERVR